MSGDPDDDISLEDLQAQIDMSMAQTHSLVSSWIKPQKNATKSKRIDLEKELLEAATRRPRLGVGATSSDASASLPRETARLKGQLVGKKRQREQEESQAAKMDVDDEEESRAGAIKKKTKADPFDKPKKKKASALALATPSTSKVKTVNEAVAEPSGTNSSAKKEQNDSKKAPQSSVDLKRAHTTNQTPAAGPSKSNDNDKLDTLSTTSSTVSNDVLPTPASPIRLSSSSSLLKGSNLPSPSRLPTELLNKPVLNLQQLSDDSDSDEGVNKSTPSSPKKKRRRRKKKKTAALSNPTSPAPAQPSSTVKILIS